MLQKQRKKFIYKEFIQLDIYTCSLSFYSRTFKHVLDPSCINTRSK